MKKITIATDDIDIKEVRKRIKLKQKDLAKLSGYSSQTLVSIEKNKTGKETTKDNIKECIIDYVINGINDEHLEEK